MAQPAPAKKIKPAEIVKITDSKGGVNKPVVSIPNRAILEFISEVDDLLEIQFVDPETEEPYSLAVPIPAYSSAYFVGNNNGTLESTIEYNIQPVVGSDKTKKPARAMANNKIVVGGGGVPEMSKRRR
ncbi:MAG: hypothetical protein ACRD59_03335 [Candidatus Acidiferrales bacterium]